DVIACRHLPRTAPALTLPASQGYALQLVDSRWSVQQALTSDNLPTLLQLFIRGNPFRSSASQVELAQQYIEALGEQLHAVAIYGSPYVLPTLKLPADVPVIFCYGQMPVAQTVTLEALMGLQAQTSLTAVDSSFTD
ncbi:MAG: beta-glucosidase, partial [Cyanobacteria bacterium J06632_22]